MNQDFNSVEIDANAPLDNKTLRRKRGSFRPRWNLLTLLLLVPVVASWLVVLSKYRENARLRAGIQTMQSQLVVPSLRIEHPDRAAVVRLPETWPKEMKWALELPSEEAVASGGAAYKLCLATKEIGLLSQGFPAAKDAILPPGRHELELKAVGKAGEWKIIALIDDQPVIEITESADWDPGYGRAGLGTPMDQSYQPSHIAETVILHQEVFLVAKPNGVSGLPNESSNGILMWLQPIEGT